MRARRITDALSKIIEWVERKYEREFRKHLRMEKSY